MSNCAIILAGGEGKRMKSNLPKPMSEVLGKPMLRWVIDSVKSAGVDDICVVKGYKKECIDEFVSSLPFEVETVYQAERLGTGHAVMMAKDFLEKHSGNVVILNGDAPFMDAKTISDALALHTEKGSVATVISAKVSDPTGYGRIVRDENNNFLKIVEQKATLLSSILDDATGYGRIIRAGSEVLKIVEHKDCNEEEKKINEINSGGFWFNCEKLLSVLGEIKSDNNAKEYYLPDALKLLLDKNEVVSAFVSSNPDTVLGANDPEQLKELNEIAKSKGYK